MEAEDGGQEVDFCPLNFTEAGAVDDLDEDHLVPLEALNLRLALLNLEHCRETGLGDEASGERMKMADIILKYWAMGSKRNVEHGLLIPNLLPVTAGCETAIEILFIPHSCIPKEVCLKLRLILIALLFLASVNA